MAMETAKPDPVEADQMARRSHWELSEKLSDLEAQLSERVERDRIRELEVSALRHELELRFAYNTSLENSVTELNARVEWLRTHTEELTRLLDAERDRAEQADRRREAAEKELVAERARISHRVMEKVIRLMGAGPKPARTPRDG